MEQRNTWKGLLAFMGSLRGDMANITAPPAFIATTSVLENPSCWTTRPSLFVAAANEPDPLKRTLRVLEWVIYALKAEYYAGQDPKTSMRKPLNAFLGELFHGEWTDETGTAHLYTEQVSHHPPITASYMCNEEHGVRGYGYARVEMTFSGSIKVRQIGHLLLHLEKYDEYYLVPLPTCRIKGFLSRKLYPEISGTHHVASSNGFVSEMSFSGEGFLSGTRHGFTAKIYRASDETRSALYTLKGNWDKEFTVSSSADASDTVTHQVDKPQESPIQIPSIDEQDPWETRRAWNAVTEALKRNNWSDVIREKTKLEEAQRAMRREELKEGRKWEPKFFVAHEDDEIASRLAAQVGTQLHAKDTKGVWRIDREKVQQATKPYHGSFTPFGKT